MDAHRSHGVTIPTAGGRDEQPRLSVGFILQPEFTLVAFSAFVDALRLAADERDASRPIRCAWSVVSDSSAPIGASCGVDVRPTTLAADPASFDYIVVVGGLLRGGWRISPRIVDYLRAAARAGVPLIGICTGSFVLARAGLMGGYRSCVSWFHHDDFQREFPELSVTASELFTMDRDRITCAGGTSVVHLAAHLIERHCGKADAAKALRILIERTALPPRSPQPQPLYTEETDNAPVRRAMLSIERGMGTPMSFERVARETHLSLRQLQRLFRSEIGMSPSAFALRMRLQTAHQMLTASAASISEIALQFGFSDCSHFSRSFRKQYSETPSEVRKRQGGRGGAARRVSAEMPVSGGGAPSASLQTPTRT